MQPEIITSRQNALMTHIRKLAGSRSYRYACGEYLCDGVKLLEEAVKWNAPLTAAVFSEGTDIPALPGNVRTVQVHIHNLRGKIEPDPAKPIYLKNVWGKGYVFRPEGQPEL